MSYSLQPPRSIAWRADHIERVRFCVVAKAAGRSAGNGRGNPLQFDAFPCGDDQVASAAFGGDHSSCGQNDAYAFRVVQGEQFAGGELFSRYRYVVHVSSMLFTHP